MSTLSPALVESQPSPMWVPRLDISACRPLAATPCPSRRYAHGQYAIEVPEATTASTSASSNQTP